MEFPKAEWLRQSVFFPQQNRVVFKTSPDIFHTEFGKEGAVVTNAKEPVERRRHGWFRATKDAYIALRSDYLRLARIECVSMDGLEFCYVADSGPVSEPFELDIFLAGSAFYLYRVPFKTISHYETGNDIMFPWLPVRRCGVQFGKLTLNQKDMLEYFIRNYTICEAHQEPNLH